MMTFAAHLAVCALGVWGANHGPGDWVMWRVVTAAQVMVAHALLAMGAWHPALAFFAMLSGGGMVATIGASPEGLCAALLTLAAAEMAALHAPWRGGWAVAARGAGAASVAAVATAAEWDPRVVLAFCAAAQYAALSAGKSRAETIVLACCVAVSAPFSPR